MNRNSCKTVRRSVALPCELIEEARAAAPPELRDNFNRLVHRALLEFARNRKKENFERAISEMAADPAIRREIGAISEELLESESDGL